MLDGSARCPRPSKGATSGCTESGKFTYTADETKQSERIVAGNQVGRTLVHLWPDRSDPRPLRRDHDRVRPLSVPYDVMLIATAIVASASIAFARTSPAKLGRAVARVLAVLLFIDALSFVAAQIASGHASLAASLPFPLCDAAIVVTGAALWWQIPVLVELAWFWGMAGTLQALVTPDLDSAFPSLMFFQYVVGHAAVVAGALMLVAGFRTWPRPGAVPRTFALTAAYAGFVGGVDAVTGANYMFLRHPPARWTLLTLLGPWPWYIASAAGVALALFALLDAPFRAAGRKSRGGRVLDSRTLPAH